jgi:hypothetical protein
MKLPIARRLALWLTLATQLAALVLLAIDATGWQVTALGWLVKGADWDGSSHSRTLIGTTDSLIAFWWLGAFILMLVGQLVAILLVLTQSRLHAAWRLLFSVSFLALGPLAVVPYALHQLLPRRAA